MIFKGFVSGSYQSQAATADQERTVNFYVEKMESQGATSDAALYPTPGVTELSKATSGSGRAHFSMDGREFAIIGSVLFEIDSAGTQTSRGTVAIDANPATISSNGDGGGQLFITSGTNGYNFNLATNTLTQVAFLNGKATMGGQLDGYFLALDAATSTLYVSNLLDGLTWDALDFAQRSIAPDPWIGMKVSGRYIWLFGEYTSEVWYNNGGVFPFAFHPSGFVLFGIAAPFSATILGRDILWLGGSREGRANVLRASGFTPEVISTFPLQNEISDYSTISDAQGDSYSDRGHNFFILTFPAEGKTKAWDSETGLWAERGTWIAENSAYAAWRPRWHAFAFGEHRMLDSETGSVYRMNTEILTDVDSRPLRRLRRAPALMAENDRVFYSKFSVDLEPGLADSTGQGSNPQVMMRMSDDGGKTWGTEQMRTAGAIGAYSTRVEWHRLGAARRRVFEVSMTDPAPWKLTSAYLTLAQPVAGNAQDGGGI